MTREERRKALEATFKSKDTEEWLDIKFTRPVGFWWALQFNRLNVHPNVVTVISIVLGVFAGVCFYYESVWRNLIGVLLLIVADTLDSADGQLARMTGKRTLWGRLLDGFAGDIWFFCIYLFIGLRLTHTPMPFGSGQEWGIWIWVLMFVSGILCHKDQAGLADYYRNIYLLYLLNASELDNSRELAAEQKNTPWSKWFWKIWLFFYQRYTIRQERCTPQFQRMSALMGEKYGREVPEELRRDLCRRMYPLLKWTNILTFNTRAIVLYIVVLCGQPWLYFVFELTVLECIYLYMRYSHERICREVSDSIGQ